VSCREEILSAIRRHRLTEFSAQDLVEIFRLEGSRYAASTVRTHVTSRMCGNAPDNHATVYADLKRVGRGRYRAL
jgi:hypothetical protein